MAFSLLMDECNEEARQTTQVLRKAAPRPARAPTGPRPLAATAPAAAQLWLVRCKFCRGMALAGNGKETDMPLTRSILAGAAFALAFGAAHAADKPDKTRDLPGFNQMDKDKDGSLARVEASGNPELARRFNEVDTDGDGKVSRFEYLKAMAREDFTALRERVADFIEPEPDSATSGDTKQRR
jgi:hypothetical protein